MKQTLRIEIDKHGEETKVLMLETEEGDDWRALLPYIKFPCLSAFIWDWEIEVLRKITKYGSEEDQKTTWGQVKERWYELKNEHGVTLDDHL